MKLINMFDAAYRAFVGAFDTPLARRQFDNEYASDARQRLREFNAEFPLAFEEAMTLLEQANNYGVRSQMSDEWCSRLDKLLNKQEES